MRKSYTVYNYFVQPSLITEGKRIHRVQCQHLKERI